MTFTTKIKDEISKIIPNNIESRIELLTFLSFAGNFYKDKISLTIENASVARSLYKQIKEIYGINIGITVRNQKRFRIKQIYILEIKEKLKAIISELKDIENEYILESSEEKAAFLKGVFLACGSINDPANGGYHLEFFTKIKKLANLIIKVLKHFDILSKVIKRENGYMVYLKEAEKISDFIRLLGATNCLFHFEDIRIYRDHKNMVNRLNNCEIANQEKIIDNGLKQLKDISYLKEYNLIDLLDDKTKIILEYREKYPEVSYVELAEIISYETDITISKSGINHHFIKVRNLIKKNKAK